ncbi:MAG TPA: HAMP domain-containing sensor histidine kinase, partial [Longimicrobium sp.]|nr:HAMP domain-containing sensor histidine kinase [Longimicrobium sp.]
IQPYIRTHALTHSPVTPRPRRPGTSVLPAVFLAAALALTAGLAYQAVDAERSHRAAAERALADYAAFAAGELARRVQETLETAAMTVQRFPIAVAEKRLRAGEPLPPVEEFLAAVLDEDHWCLCLSHAREAFRVDFPSGRATWTGAPSPALRRDVEARVRAHAASLDGRPGEVTIDIHGAAEGETGTGHYQLRIRQTEAAVVDAGGRLVALPYTLVFDRDSSVRAAYGVVADPARMLGEVAPRVAVRHPLLPPTLTGGVPNDSLVALRLEGPGGRLLWARGDFGGRYAAADTFAGRFEGVVARASLHPGAARRLLIGGVPASRLPLVAVLLALTAGLVVVALLQVRRQNELARLRADFVSGVSHELRTPLTQIRMFAELLAGGRLRSEEERRRSARLIDQEARRLSYLVENVLDFSRAERGAARLAPEPTDVAAAVREALEAFAPVAGSRGVALRTALEEGVTAEVDRGALRQVLLNFLDNAVKYGPAGQTVSVGAARAGGAVRVWVEDACPGVPAAARARVWEPYVRLDREPERVSGGSGIGLAVVRSLVRLHGGAAWVDSAPAGGARFVAELPLSTAAPVGPAPAGAAAGGA